MSRIAETFLRLKHEGRNGLIPFIMAGDPNLRTTAELMIELARAGACMIEIGVPFSDPVADGPVIQRAAARALAHDVGVEDVVSLIEEVRPEIDIPVILFSYLNPLLRFGVSELPSALAAAHIAGLLITDCPPECSNGFSDQLAEAGVDQIFLIAPTTSDERLRLISSRGSGFVYAVSRNGVTGQQEQLDREAELLVHRVRRCSDLPVAVGFGISTRSHVEQVWKYADAAVVGSAIVAEVERIGDSPTLVKKVGQFTKRLNGAGGINADSNETECNGR